MATDVGQMSLSSIQGLSSQARLAAQFAYAFLLASTLLLHALVVAWTPYWWGLLWYGQPPPHGPTEPTAVDLLADGIWLFLVLATIACANMCVAAWGVVLMCMQTERVVHCPTARRS